MDNNEINVEYEQIPTPNITPKRPAPIRPRPVVAENAKKEVKPEKPEKVETPNKVEKIENIEDQDFTYNTKKVLADFFKFKNFKRLPLALSILWGILLFPFLLSVILLGAMYYVTLFAYKLTLAPLDYILDFIRKEGTHVAVKVVVYFFGFPVALVLKVFGAFFSVFFFAMHFLIVLFGYIYGFGGITFHAFLYDKKYIDKIFSIDVASKTEVIVCATLVTIMLATLVFGTIGGIVDSVTRVNVYNDTITSYYDSYAYAKNLTISDKHNEFKYSMSLSDYDNERWMKVSGDSYDSIQMNFNPNYSITVYVYENYNKAVNDDTYDVWSMSYKTTFNLNPTSYTTYYFKLVSNTYDTNNISLTITK